MRDNIFDFANKQCSITHIRFSLPTVKNVRSTKHLNREYLPYITPACIPTYKNYQFSIDDHLHHAAQKSALSRFLPYQTYQASQLARAQTARRNDARSIVPNPLESSPQQLACASLRVIIYRSRCATTTTRLSDLGNRYATSLSLASE